MKNLKDKVNVNAPDGTYEYGSMRDNPGDNTGTPLDKDLFDDVMQFVERMMDESGTAANGLPDNTTNGYQIYEAFRKLTKPYKVHTSLVSQSGSSAPTETVLKSELSGALSWSRVSTGVYQGTLASEFVSGKTWTVANTDENLGTFTFGRVDSNTVEIRSFSSGGSPTDGILTSSPIEIRIYD